MKKIIITSLMIFMIFSMIGCDNTDSETMSGEGEYWEVEFTFPEDEDNYYYTLSYKGDVEALTPEDNISMGYLWLHKDAELIVDENLEESFADIMLNQPAHALNEMIVFHGSSGNSVSDLNINTSSNIRIIDGEVEVIHGDQLSRSEREKKASDMRFAVIWGENSESFIVD